MYYISKEGHTSPARVVKRLKDFMKSPNAIEGSTWTLYFSRCNRKFRITDRKEAG